MRSLHLMKVVALVSIQLGAYFWLNVEVQANQLVNKEQAIEIALRESAKLEIVSDELEVEVDDGNRRWNEFMSILESSKVEMSRKRFELYESKLRGRDYWTVYLLPKRIEGRRPKGGGATILVDARSGAVLIAIRGE